MGILITGSNGFVGAALTALLKAKCKKVIECVRKSDKPSDIYQVGNIDSVTDWSIPLVGCRYVVHLAARAHILDEESVDPLTLYRSVNTEGTLNLARQAASAGVKRFIFLSSIGVNGNQTHTRPFSVNDRESPHSAYAISKYEAEVGLKEIARSSNMEVVVIRAPLVYGKNAPGNFSNLVRLVKMGSPLPLGAVTNNRRSFVAIDNLVDLIVLCIYHSAAANRIFFAADGEDLSTASLLKRLGIAMNKTVRLFWVPPFILKTVAICLGKRSMAQQLLGDLQVDISHTRQILSWSPPISVDEGLIRSVEGLG